MDGCGQVARIAERKRGINIGEALASCRIALGARLPPCCLAWLEECCVGVDGWRGSPAAPARLRGLRPQGLPRVAVAGFVDCGHEGKRSQEEDEADDNSRVAHLAARSWRFCSLRSSAGDGSSSGCPLMIERMRALLTFSFSLLLRPMTTRTSSRRSVWFFLSVMVISLLGRPLWSGTPIRTGLGVLSRIGPGGLIPPTSLSEPKAQDYTNLNRNNKCG